MARSLVEHGKSLGLIVDSQLRFSDYVSYMLKKTYIAIKLLYPQRQYLDRNIKKELCDSLVLSHFNHCDYVYGPCLSSHDLYRIQKIQNHCIRFIFGIRRRNRVSYKPKELSWLNMLNRRKLHALCLYYKLIKFNTIPTL